MSTEDTTVESTLSLRTDAQLQAFRLAWQVLGDLTGFGTTYFDVDNTGYVKTATEVSSDNSALMRNVRKNENALQTPLIDVARAVVACSRHLGENVPDEDTLTVQFDDSIVQDTEAKKARDMAEVGTTMHAWEYRMKWYGEDETTAKERARGLERKSGATAQR